MGPRKKQLNIYDSVQKTDTRYIKNAKVTSIWDDHELLPADINLTNII
jgi:hypothetical protein